MQPVETSIAKISFVEQDILRVELKEDAVVSKESLNELIETYEVLKISKPMYFLNVLKALNSAEFGIKEIFEEEERMHMKIAEAFVINSLSNRIELGFNIQKTKKHYPTAVFTNEKDALKWLQAVKLKSFK